jgi:hypothetical protein
MNGLLVLILWTTTAACIALVVEWSSAVAWMNANTGLASWVQALGSIAAIVATGLYVRWQHNLENTHQKLQEMEARQHADAAVLLSLQNLASELRRMNVLAAFQIDQPGNQIIYPDIAATFAAVGAVFDQLPVRQIVMLGELDAFLSLRRYSSDLHKIYAVSPKQGDGFYRRNREQLEKLQRSCIAQSLRLADKIRTLDPGLYVANKQQIERM